MKLALQYDGKLRAELPLMAVAEWSKGRFYG